jgi:hypothetical protein
VFLPLEASAYPVDRTSLRNRDSERGSLEFSAI